MIMAGKQEYDANLKKALADMKSRAKKGMFLAVALVKRESQKRTPVDEGNLKGSHYTSVQTDSDGVKGEIGLTADYAIYVHEDLEAFHPTGEAKFLENAVKENEHSIITLIQKAAKV